MEFVERLLELGGDINQPNAKHWNAMTAAAFVGNTKLISYLYANGGDGGVFIFLLL